MLGFTLQKFVDSSKNCPKSRPVFRGIQLAYSTNAKNTRVDELMFAYVPILMFLPIS